MSHPPSATGPRQTRVDTSATATSSAAAAAGAAIVGIVSPVAATAANMFKDGLHMIGAFLDDHDWFVTLKVCHHWLNSISSSPTRGLSYPIEADGGRFGSVPPIRLLHHFTQFKCLGGNFAEFQLTMHANQLFSLGRTFPYLTQLPRVIVKCDLDRPVITNTSIAPECTWPIGLKDLAISTSRADELEPYSLIRVISTCMSLIRLELSITQPNDFSLFHSFNQLIRLETFHFYLDDVHNPRERIDLLTMMGWHELGGRPPNLLELNICSGNSKYFWIETFSRTVPWTKLEYIRLPPNLIEGDLTRIACGAPNLTTIRLETYPFSELVDLQQFSLLRTIHLWKAPVMSDSDDIDQEMESRMMHAFSGCTHLTSLQFHLWVPQSFNSWLELSTLTKLVEVIFHCCHLKLLDVLLPLKSLLKIVISDEPETSPYVRHFFRSSAVMPQLTHIEIVDFHEEAKWIWTKDGTNNTIRMDQFREPLLQQTHTPNQTQTPTPTITILTDLTSDGVEPTPPDFTPDAPLIGIETNPGPGPFGNTNTNVKPQTLFADGLHTIYSYLTLPDWLSSMHTCHHWYVCGCSQPPRELTWNAHIFTGDPSAAASSVHGPSVVDSLPTFNLLSHFSYFIRGNKNFTSDDCFRRIQPFTNITRMNVRLFVDASSLQLCQWPNRLIHLSLTLFHLPSTHLLQSLTQQLSHQLESLLLDQLQPIHLTTLDKRLQLFQRLTRLELIGVYPIDAHSFQLKIDFWSHLPISLTYFDAHNYNSEALYLATDLSLLPQLTHFGIPVLKQNELESMVSVAPNLEQLIPTSPFHFVDLPVFKLFKSLHTIHFTMEPTDYPLDESMTPLITHLSNCHSLTYLNFDSWITFTREEWCQLSGGIPGLIELELFSPTDQILESLNQSLTPQTFVNLQYLSVWDNYSIELKSTLNNRLVCPNLLAFALGSYGGEEFFEFDTKFKKNIDWYRLDDGSSDRTIHSGVPYISPRKDLTREGVEENPGPTGLANHALLNHSTHVDHTLSDLSTHISRIHITSSVALTTVIPSRLLKDMIHLINSYLDDTDWLASMQVCHHWLACSASSPSRLISFPIDDSGQVLYLPPLRLLHHFTSIRRNRLYVRPRVIGLTPTHICTLSQQLPHLTHISCDINKRLSIDLMSRVIWPNRLRTLDINLEQRVCTALIASIFSSPTITNLKLEWISPKEDMTIFKSVNQLVHLESLSLHLLVNVDIDLLSVMKLTHLPRHLKYFSLSNGIEGFLYPTALVTMTPAVELEELNLTDREIFGPTDFELIHQFAPNLRRMKCHPSHLSPVKQFHALQYLHLFRPAGDPDDTEYNTMIGHLAAAEQLISIVFDRWVPSTPAYWFQLSSGLIHLTSLEFIVYEHHPPLELLRHFRSLTSLTFTVFTAAFYRMISDFFKSPELMPNLHRLAFGFGGSPPFVWLAGEPRVDNYRSNQITPLIKGNDVAVQPPASPLVGVELNPGPSGLPMPGPTFHSLATMFNDGLHLIFSYLNSDDWITAMNTCHHWSRIGLSSSTRNMLFNYQPERPMPCLVFPPPRLAPHFTRCVFRFFHITELVTLVEKLPRLVEMRLYVGSQAVADQSITFPSQLRSLTISLFRSNVSLLLSSIRTVASTLTSLTLDECSPSYPFNDEFGSMLMSLTNLTQLAVQVKNNAAPERDFITVCKLNSLSPLLTSLNLFGGHYSILDSIHLLSPIHTLTDMNLSSPFTHHQAPHVSVDMLLRLHRFAPNLIHLAPTMIYYSDFTDQLPAFKHLQTFRISGFSGTASRQSFLLPTLARCPSITSIRMGEWDLPSLDDWRAFTLAMPQLQRLAIRVWDMGDHEDIELILAGIQLLPQLRSFTMNGGFYEDEMEQFKDLFKNTVLFPRLTHLMLDSESHGSFEYDLDRGINLSFRVSSSQHQQQRTIAQTLFVDGLLSIFSWLTLSDLLPALHSCHYWYSSGQKERSRQFEYEWKSIESRFSNLIQSPTRIHIGSITKFSCTDDMTYINQIHQLSHLRTFDWEMRDSTPNEPLSTSFTFPVSLIRLTITLLYRCQSFQLAQSLIDLLPTAASRLIELDFGYYNGGVTTPAPYHFDFSGLSKLSCLRILKLFGPYPLNQVDQLICANLSLTKMSTPSRSIDLSIFHPDTPFMHTIQDWCWGGWNPTEADWYHLTQHPPPQLRLLTIYYDSTAPFSLAASTCLIGFHLTHLTLHGTLPHHLQHEPTRYRFLVTPLKSLKSLTITGINTDPRLIEDDLYDILNQLNLDEFSTSLYINSGTPSPKILAALKLLPPKTTFTSFKIETFQVFATIMTHLERLVVLHIKHLWITETKFKILPQEKQIEHLLHFCHSEMMSTSVRQLTIGQINYNTMAFNYNKSNTSQPHQSNPNTDLTTESPQSPNDRRDGTNEQTHHADVIRTQQVSQMPQDGPRPIEPLVGIELNPGPISLTTQTTAAQTLITTGSFTQTTAQTLFVDGLLSIFGWLTLSELIPALHSCHYWYSCGMKERSRQLEYEWKSIESHWSNFICSPIRFHITSIVAFTLKDMTSIHRIKRLTQIQVFQFLLNEDTQFNQPLPSSFIYPESLITLKIGVTHRCLAHRLRQSMIDILPTAAPQLIHFELSYSRTTGDHFHFDLTPLTRLSNLKTLLLDLPDPFTRDEQQVCAKLALTNMTFPSLPFNSSHPPEWTILGPDSPFMASIQEWHWGDWLPNDEDWDHLTSHPPPQLHTLTLRYDSTRPMSSRLSALPLTNLTVFTYYSDRQLEPSRYGTIIAEVQTLTSLRLDDIRLVDEELCLILNHLKLDSLSVNSPRSSKVSSLKLLPRHSTMDSFTIHSFQQFISNLCQAKELQVLHIHNLRMATCTTLDQLDQFAELERFCHSNEMDNLKQLTIDCLNSRSIKFKFINSINTHPPAPRLIDVEENPGPTLNVITPSRLRSTNDCLSLSGANVDGANLFADGLHIIYSYLTDREFFHVVHVSRHWSHCCSTCPSRQMEYYSTWVKDSSEHITRESRLNYHFTRLELPHKSHARLFLSELIQLIRLLPYLTTMAVAIMKRSDDVPSGDSVPWPQRLRSLSCSFEGRDYPRLFRSICQLSSLTSLSLESLGSRCVGFDPSDSFRRFTQLTTLQIRQYEPDPDPLQFLTAPSIFFPPTVTNLTIYSHHFLGALTRTHHYLRQVRKLHLVYLTLKPNGLRIIHSHMPDLEVLDGVQFDHYPSDVSIFTRLESLSIHFPEFNFSTASLHPFIVVMGELSQLTHLQLMPNSFPTQQDWAHAYRSLVHLTSLQIDVFVPHSSPFAHLGIFADRLKRLTIISRLITSNDLCIISALGSLEYLSLSSHLTASTNWTPEIQVNDWKWFFRSTETLPLLQTLLLRCASFSFVWDERKSMNIWAYRQKSQSSNQLTTVTPPAQPLVGIETNPGPTDRPISPNMTSTTGSPIATAPQQNLASTLFASGLHIIYSYLSDHEFFHVLHVSRHWSHCCSTGPSRHMEYYSLWMKDDSEHISRDSRLNYHFTRFESPQNTASRLYLSELTSIIQLLPHLTTIDISIKKQSTDLSNKDSIEWPHRLNSLKCKFYGYDYPHLFSSICQLHSLTSLTFGSVGSPCYGFRPSDSFRLLTQLITLSIWPTNPTTDDPLQLSTAPIIWLPPTVTELSIFSKHFMNALPRIENIGQVRKLSLVYYNLESNDLRIIHSHMPELVQLDGIQLCLTDLDDIILFSHLKSLHIQQFPHHNFLPSMHHLIDCLGQLSQLSHLQLKPDIFPIDEYWIHLHRSLSHLISLQLDSFTTQSIPIQHLTSFSERLKRLTITCLDITQSDLIIISTLIQLEYLSLTHLIEDSSKIKPPQQHLNELKDFFDSTDILLHLQELHLICVSSNGSRLCRFSWDQQKPINIWTYRLKSRYHSNQPQNDTTALTPPEPLLVGIETNPGPLSQATSAPGGPIIPLSTSSNASGRLTAAIMFRDGIHTIYSFLTTNEWLHSVRTCTNWFAAGISLDELGPGLSSTPTKCFAGGCA